MPIQVANNAASVLTGALSTGALALSITGGDGVLFPALGAGDVFQATLTKLVSGVPVNEIIRVTARTGDTMTIVRAQEGTTPQSFSAGDRIEIRFTKAAYDSKANLDGAAFTGPVSMSAPTTMQDQPLIGAVLKDASAAYFDSAAVNTIDYAAGSHQRWAPATGAQTIAINNWPPAGQHGDLLIEGVNLGAATITGPSVRWITSTGAFTTTTAWNTNHGATLQASGTDFILLWTRDGGATIYGKVIR